VPLFTWIVVREFRVELSLVLLNRHDPNRLGFESLKQFKKPTRFIAAGVVLIFH
jgi:hypothetical protein